MPDPSQPAAASPADALTPLPAPPVPVPPVAAPADPSRFVANMQGAISAWKAAGSSDKDLPGLQQALQWNYDKAAPSGFFASGEGQQIGHLVRQQFGVQDPSQGNPSPSQSNQGSSQTGPVDGVGPSDYTPKFTPPPGAVSMPPPLGGPSAQSADPAQQAYLASTLATAHYSNLLKNSAATSPQLTDAFSGMQSAIKQYIQLNSAKDPQAFAGPDHQTFLADVVKNGTLSQETVNEAEGLVREYAKRLACEHGIEGVQAVFAHGSATARQVSRQAESLNPATVPAQAKPASLTPADHSPVPADTPPSLALTWGAAMEAIVQGQVSGMPSRTC